MCHAARSIRTTAWAPGLTRLGELVEHGLHGGGAHRRQGQRDTDVAGRADGAEQIDRLVAQVADPARAHPPLEPPATVPQRLPIHAGLTGGLPPIHAIQGVGQAEQPGGHPAVGLAPGQTTQLLGRNALADRSASGIGRPSRCITMQPEE
jgi:hypothetical protein